MQISRLFKMLYILLERRQATAPELARELEVSVRTVYRDVQLLCEAGVPLYAGQGRGGGISILPTYKLNKSILSEDERSSILSALCACVQTGAGDQEILSKLSAFFGKRDCDWVQIDFADWSGQQDDVIAVLKQAILEKQLLAFDYYSEAGMKTTRQVCPLLLWFKGQSWYLRAFCLSRNAVRTFKLTRLKRPVLIPGSFPPAALEARQSDIPSTQWPEPEHVRLLLHVNACMAFRIFDDFCEESISRMEDGSFLIDAHFPPGAWIRSIILGYGEHAQVLEPLELKNEICETLKKMISLYET